MNLIRWTDPFDLLTNLDRDMVSRGRDVSFMPELDLSEDENHYIVRADLPGIRKEDLEISLQGNILTLKGEKKEEKELKQKNFHAVERRYGSFQRMVEFPDEVNGNDVKASLKDGVLELTIPKSEKSKPKQIQIEVK